VLASRFLKAKRQRWLIAFSITPGQFGDASLATALLALSLTAQLCLTGTAYDSDALHCFMLDRDTLAVIPNNPTCMRYHPIRPVGLQTAQSSRTHVLPTQRLTPHRHLIRQTRRHLRGRLDYRLCRPPVDLIGSNALPMWPCTLRRAWKSSGEEAEVPFRAPFRSLPRSSGTSAIGWSSLSHPSSSSEGPVQFARDARAR
jgi:hypothetical protein